MVPTFSSPTVPIPPPTYQRAQMKAQPALHLDAPLLGDPPPFAGPVSARGATGPATVSTPFTRWSWRPSARLL